MYILVHVYEHSWGAYAISSYVNSSNMRVSQGSFVGRVCLSKGNSLEEKKVCVIIRVNGSDWEPGRTWKDCTVPSVHIYGLRYFSPRRQRVLWRHGLSVMALIHETSETGLINGPVGELSLIRALMNHLKV